MRRRWHRANLPRRISPITTTGLAVNSSRRHATWSPAQRKAHRLRSRNMTTNALSFVGDVGGTNARFALVKNGKIVPKSIHNCVNREYETTIDAIRSFLEAHGNPKVTSACLALACPITGDTVKLTN